MAKSKNRLRNKKAPKTSAPIKKGKPKKNISKLQYDGKLSIVIAPFKEDFRTTKSYIQQSIATISASEIIITGGGFSEDQIRTLKEQYTEVIDLLIIPEGSISDGVAAANSYHVLVLDDLMINPSNLVAWINEKGEAPEDEIWAASRLHDDTQLGKSNKKMSTKAWLLNTFSRLFVGIVSRDVMVGFRFMPTNMAKVLFGNLASTDKNYGIELLHLAKMYDFAVIDRPMTVSAPMTEVGWGEAFVVSIGAWLKSWVTWIKHYFVHPIKDVRKDYFAKRESPWYRLAFAIVALLVFVAMPYLSADYGMTADEHVQNEYGEKLLDYYETDGENFDALFYKDLYNYGGLFEYTSAWCNENLAWFDDPYDMRHFLNSLFGAFMMLFIGLVGRLMSGSWAVALITILFAVLSPRLFGHSMNNPKDIPFAATFIFTVYHSIRFIQQLPKPTLRTSLAVALGIAAAINIRVGGLLLIAYLGAFTGIAFLWKPALRKQLLNIRLMVKMFAILGLIALTGLWFGSTYWPYAALDWFNNPFNVLDKMSHYYLNFRVLFDSTYFYSDMVPWSYLPKWMWYTTPLFALFGFFASPVLAFLRRAQGKSLVIFLVTFACLFPICYVIYQKSGLYDGMRHMLFAYTLFPVLAAFAWYSLIQLFKHKVVKIGLTSFMVVLMISPLIFMVKNHPYQYTYFNELIGGNNGAFMKYESDYWMVGVEPACEWYLDNIIAKEKTGDTIILATNCINPVSHYLGGKRIQVKYVKYQEREKYAWDYGLFYSRFVDRELMANGAWPPEELLHAEKVDDIPITVIVKRKSDPKGLVGSALNRKDWRTAASLLQEIVKDNPRNESAYLLLAQTYSKSGEWSKMKDALDNLLEISDQESDTWGLVGFYYLGVDNQVSAREAFEKAIEIDYKYTYGIFNLAVMRYNEKDNSAAMNLLYDFDRYGGSPIEGYDLAIHIAESTGNRRDNYYFTAKRMSLNSEWKGALRILSSCLAISPNFEPALRLKRSCDESLAHQELKSTLTKANGNK